MRPTLEYTGENTEECGSVCPDYSGYLFIVTIIYKKPGWGPSCTKPGLQTRQSSHYTLSQDKHGKIRDKNLTENWSLLRQATVF